MSPTDGSGLRAAWIHLRDIWEEVSKEPVELPGLREKDLGMDEAARSSLLQKQLPAGAM